LNALARLATREVISSRFV